MPVLAIALVGAYAPPAMPTDPLRPFTTAQERIAEALADGFSATDIAGLVGCSYHTVRAHIRAMANVLPGDGPQQERVRSFAQARRTRVA